jgi:hypothetical protein
LQGWFATRKDNHTGVSYTLGNNLFPRHTLTADKICIAKLAYGFAAIFFSTRPQIASGKAHKYCSLAHVKALTLH